VDDLQDSVAFAQQLGRRTFIARRDRDGYTYLCSDAIASSDEEAVARIVEDLGEGWTITPATATS
jgi:hypothetical protein